MTHKIMKTAVESVQHDEVYTLWNDADKLELHSRRNKIRLNSPNACHHFWVQNLLSPFILARNVKLALYGCNTVSVVVGEE
jgi:hypothetical protein